MSVRSNNTLRLTAGGVLLVGSGGGAALLAGVAGAQTVDPAALEPQVAQTYTVANTNDSGAGSLRAAVTSANANAGADTITFDPSVTGTITLTSGEIAITDSITITGPGAGNLAISGNDASRVFKVTGTADVVVSSITLTHGSTLSIGNGFSANGGVLAAAQAGSLVVSDVEISNGRSGNYGGGIFAGNDGDVTITNSQILNNRADNGGGISVFSFSPGTVTISGSMISGNQAGDGLVGTRTAGGGLEGYGYKTFDIRDTTFDRNSVVGTAPGASSNGYPGGGGGADFITEAPVSITNVTFSNNSVTNGAASALQMISTSTVLIANSTFAGNTESTLSAGSAEGAIGLCNFFGAGEFKILSSTVSDNSSNGVVSGVSTVAKTGFPPPTVHLYDTVIAANRGGSDLGFSDYWIDGTSPANNAFTLKAAHSLIGSIRATTPLTDNGGNQTGVADPMLAPLANNGGRTKTMALLPGSPLLDAGGATVPTFPRNQFDQRGSGFARLVGSGLDIGAFEAQPPAPTPTPTIDPAAPVVPIFTG